MTTREAIKEAHCNGVNHRDSGKVSDCKNCGRTIVRTGKGKVFNLCHSTNFNGFEYHFFRCYNPQHQCDPAETAAYSSAKAVSIASGQMVIGQSVVVARGRKIPKGTTGTITWTGESDFGPRARVQPENGEAFFIAMSNLDVKASA